MYICVVTYISLYIYISFHVCICYVSVYIYIYICAVTYILLYISHFMYVYDIYQCIYVIKCVPIVVTKFFFSLNFPNIVYRTKNCFPYCATSAVESVPPPCGFLKQTKRWIVKHGDVVSNQKIFHMNLDIVIVFPLGPLGSDCPEPGAFCFVPVLGN